MSSGEANRMDEARLEGVLDRARGGDAEAFAELYRGFSRRVLGLCRHLLRSAEEAEDATSEVFLRMQRSLASYDGALPFSRWLLSIASHHCVDRLRRRRLEQRLFQAEAAEESEVSSPGPSALSQLLRAEERGRVQQAIAALPDRYRVPVVLRYYSELSYDQIAGALGLRRNHVATLLFRAKQELRRRLEGQGESGTGQESTP